MKYLFLVFLWILMTIVQLAFFVISPLLFMPYLFTDDVSVDFLAPLKLAGIITQNVLDSD